MDTATPQGAEPRDRRRDPLRLYLLPAALALLGLGMVGVVLGVVFPPLLLPGLVLLGLGAIGTAGGAIVDAMSAAADAAAP